VSVRIMTDKNTGKSKGYGFISYDNIESASKAIAHMNGFSVESTYYDVLKIKGWKCSLKKGMNSRCSD